MKSEPQKQAVYHQPRTEIIDLRMESSLMLVLSGKDIEIGDYDEELEW